MKYLILVLPLMLVACAVKVEHDVKGHVDPVEIKHNIVVDTTKLEAYYRLECAKTYSIQADIDKCTTEELGKFLETYTYST